MTATTIIISSYQAEAVINLLAKLDKMTAVKINEDGSVKIPSVSYDRNSPVRITLITKTARRVRKIAKLLSPEAAILRLQYHIPDAKQNRRYNEWSAYHSVSALKEAYRLQNESINQ